jgi:Coenzyme PQQ synthesis protein D (PqqD)
MTLEDVVVVSHDQVSCDLGGEAAILNLATGMYYCLNPVGARIWSLIAKPRTVSSVRDAILAEFEVEASPCERDVLDLLAKLAAEGLIQVRAAQAA